MDFHAIATPVSQSYGLFDYKFIAHLSGAACRVAGSRRLVFSSASSRSASFAAPFEPHPTTSHGRRALAEFRRGDDGRRRGSGRAARGLARGQTSRTSASRIPIRRTVAAPANRQLGGGAPARGGRDRTRSGRVGVRAAAMAGGHTRAETEERRKEGAERGTVATRAAPRSSRVLLPLVEPALQ